jgi:hypothetical protein
MATVWMYDAVNASNIPKSAQIVAGYVDGRYANYGQIVSEFPSALHVSITVLGTAGARVADCETGDLTPAQAAAWAHEEIRAGRRPTIYSNESSHGDIANALAAEGLAFQKDVDWWAAGYTNSPYLAPGSVATQWKGGMTAPYDVSDTNGVWPGAVTPPPSPHSNNDCVGIILSPTGVGYWLPSAAGKVVACGVASHGDLSGKTLAGPVVGGAPSANGYWLVAADGGVFSFGDAKFYGSAGKVSHPVVGMSAIPSHLGYWLGASDGGVFAFGSAPFRGSTGGTQLNKPVVGVCGAPNNGYWLVASDGGVFSFGDAPFHGSTGNVALRAPVVGMASSPTGGYWLVASDGGVFSFGAGFYGSTGNIKLAAPVVGIVGTPSGNGYYLVAADGGVFTYGDAVFKGA